MLIHLFGFLSFTLLLSTGVNCYYTIINGRLIAKSSCKIRSYGIKTAEQLQQVINNAKNGDTIKLDPIDYFGSFEIKNKNNKYITIDGDNQCNQNTRIIGEFNIKSNNWIISDIVFTNSRKAIGIENSNNIRLINIVISRIKENGIEVQNANDIQIDNLVIDGIGENALEFKSVNNLYLSSVILTDVGRTGILIEGTNNNIHISNTVSNGVDNEVIKITGTSNNGKIADTVINGDSAQGEAWIKIDGNNFQITGTVGTGAPKNGFLINGCGFSFNGNIFTLLGSNGFGIYLANKQKNCINHIGWGNMLIGGYALVN